MFSLTDSVLVQLPKKSVMSVLRSRVYAIPPMTEPLRCVLAKLTFSQQNVESPQEQIFSRPIVLIFSGLSRGLVGVSGCAFLSSEVTVDVGY